MNKKRVAISNTLFLYLYTGKPFQIRMGNKLCRLHPHQKIRIGGKLNAVHILGKIRSFDKNATIQKA